MGSSLRAPRRCRRRLRRVLGPAPGRSLFVHHLEGGLGFPGLLLRTLVHHRSIVVLRALAASGDDVLLRTPACLSDMKSCEPACTMLGPASRHGRPGPRAVAVLRAHASRTSDKIPAPACPRAIRRAFNGGERRSSRAIDVVNDHQRRARGHAASFIAAEQRCARAIADAPAAPIISATPTRLATAFIVGEKRCARARNVIDDDLRCARELAASFIAAEQRRARAARTPVQPQCGDVLCRAADNPAPLLEVTVRHHERRPRRAVLLLLRCERAPLLGRHRRGSAPRRRRRVAAAAPGRTRGAGGEQCTAARPRRRRFT